MRNFIACQACFRNFGFRKTLEEFGRTSDEPCPRCASTGTSKVDDDGLKEAMHKFFVSGSDITGTFTSRYALNKWNSSPSVFDATLAADAELACGLTGLVIFDYGPATWRVGQGCLSEEFDAGGELQHWAARDLVKGGEPIVIHADTPFFRVRVNPKLDASISTPAAFDPPPLAIPREPGRLDAPDHPVLYVSDNIELCLHECRVTISDEIVVATLWPLRELHILDLCAPIKPRSHSPWDDPNIFLAYIFRNRGASLEHCRAISRAARDLGYDGIRYTSYYAQAKHNIEALNLAIFGHPIADGLLHLASVNRVRISNANYAFRFGPVLFRDDATEASLAEELKGLIAGQPH